MGNETEISQQQRQASARVRYTNAAMRNTATNWDEINKETTTNQTKSDLTFRVIC